MLYCSFQVGNDFRLPPKILLELQTCFPDFLQLRDGTICLFFGSGKFRLQH